MTFSEPGITDINAVMADIARQVKQGCEAHSSLEIRVRELDINDVRQVRESARELASDAMSLARRMLETAARADALVQAMKGKS